MPACCVAVDRREDAFPDVRLLVRQYLRTPAKLEVELLERLGSFRLFPKVPRLLAKELLAD